MSKYGRVGNGFDFLIDPFRFGGQPADVTSVPYPVEALSEFEGRVDGAFDTELFGVVEEFQGVMAQATGGTIRDILKVYTHPQIDAVDSVSAIALSGDIDAILVVHNQPGFEGVDAVMARARGGELAQILIVLPKDPVSSIEGVMARALSGTLQ